MLPCRAAAARADLRAVRGRRCWSRQRKWSHDRSARRPRRPRRSRRPRRLMIRRWTAAGRGLRPRVAAAAPNTCRLTARQARHGGQGYSVQADQRVRSPRG
eukprot:scaffold130330_cov63-Phaeocystis_antarctica.AAC.1